MARERLERGMSASMGLGSARRRCGRCGQLKTNYRDGRPSLPSKSLPVLSSSQFKYGLVFSLAVLLAM